MGTRLYEKGVYINRVYDELNLSQPALIKEVHREYLAAGAMVVETNSFGANRFKLDPHGLTDKLEVINFQAAKLAREAADGNAWVAGAIGPLESALSHGEKPQSKRLKLLLPSRRVVCWPVVLTCLFLKLFLILTKFIRRSARCASLLTSR